MTVNSACGAGSGPFYGDGDGDGYGTGPSRDSCPSAGYAEVDGDCDDDNASIHPTAVERCNGLDDDCDGKVDETLGAACDAEACAALACDENAVCVLEGGERLCRCAAGFEGDGKTCSNIDDCVDSPCQNGGKCVDGVESYVCECTSTNIGKDCELEICGTVLIRTRAEMNASRLCAEVRGDLTIDPAGLSTIDANDLPFLRKVTGDVFIGAGLNSPVATPPLAVMTIGALETIGGSLYLGPNSAKEVRFPELREVGLDSGPGQRDFYLIQMVATVLDFPKLEVIGGDVELNSLQQLCSANFRKLSRIDGNAKVYYLLKLPRIQLEPIVAHAKSTEFTLYGCCIPQGGTEDCGTGTDPFSPQCQCTN